jgi:gamma-glutamyl-gamma-aminobutyrate hydrolase PuuD
VKLIGITTNSAEDKTAINNAYIDAFAGKDNNPILIPNFTKERLETDDFDTFKKIFEERAIHLAKILDALIITGGVDINPISFSEENQASFGTDTFRDYTEALLLQVFTDLNKPIMGICRGFQVIARTEQLGYYQEDVSHIGELHSGNDRSAKSRNEPMHPVMLQGEFKKFIGTETLAVNSWHHQGVTFTPSGKLPVNINTTAKLKEWHEKAIADVLEQDNVIVLAHTNSIIEGFEIPAKKTFAVQWHPEEYGTKSKTIQYFLDRYLNV